MNRLEEMESLSAQMPQIRLSKEQQIISTVVLLLLGYYIVSFRFDIWPSTIKRFSYEAALRFTPSSLIYFVQNIMTRMGRLSESSAAFTRQKFGNHEAKAEALGRIFGQSPFPTVLRSARAMSGYNKVVPSVKELGPPGLGNWDNSCYQNSVLQGLASLPAFRDYIRCQLNLCIQNEVPHKTTKALTEFLDQLADTSRPKCTVWTPSVLKSMDSWQQQDAQEYFTRILEALEKDTSAFMKAVHQKSISGLNCFDDKRLVGTAMDGASNPSMDQDVRMLRTPAKSPMDGRQAQKLECQTCGYTEGFSVTEFSCLTLNLGLSNSCDLEALLDEYTDPELIEGVECDGCTKLALGSEPEEVTSEQQKRKQPVLRSKTKQFTLGRLPQNLVLHINRSIFDEYGNQIKNTSAIRFPDYLDIISRWCALPDNPDPEAVQAVYELKCIVSHHGRHDNGHYVAFAQREDHSKRHTDDKADSDNWYCFNDEIVTRLHIDEVLRRGNVFMLFYEAATSIPSNRDSEAEPIHDLPVDQASEIRLDSINAVETAQNPPPDTTLRAMPTMKTASEMVTSNGRAGNVSPGVVAAV